MRTFTIAERQARLATRHHLTDPTSCRDGAELAALLVGLHASDPATVFLSVRGRLPDFEVTSLENALYGEASLVKHLGMRRTMFVLPRPLASLVTAACTRAIARRMRTRLVADLEAAGVTDNGARWLTRLGDAVFERLTAGPQTGAELARAVPALQTKLAYAIGKSYGGEVAVTTRVLTLLAAEGSLERGRPRGGWTSSQHTWQRPPAPPVDCEESAAQRELVERWLRSFGPAGLDDLAWWTGLGVGKIRAALRGLATVEVDLHGRAGVALADDVDEIAVPAEHVALLPALDPTTMGWKNRDWYLGHHAPRLFDRNGNAGPTVWCDGRVVGGWGQRKNGEIAVVLLEDVGSERRRAIDQEAAALTTWLGPTRVKPRFPTPLEREIRES